MAEPTYNPGDVQVVVAGILITGFADGTFINVSRNNDSYSRGTGSDGEGWRSKSNDKSGSVVITLLQTSKSNDALSALALIDEFTGDGVGPLLIKDASGTTLCAAQDCWVRKPADVTLGRDASETREWTIDTNSLNMLVGSN